MKMTDGSEKIRIRTDLAKRVREETERLRISFPEFVHFLITAYFVNVSAQSFIAANQEEEAEKPEEYSSQEIDDSDDLYEIDIDI